MRSKNRSTTRGSVIEVLESRRLLSASPLGAGVATPSLFIVGPVVPPTSSSIVILHERAGVAFTASLGTFVTIAPATNLKASITWGDGSTSAGTLKPLGVVGLDELKFEVDGTHTYHKAGRFPIQVTVIQPSVGPSTLVRLIATFHDRALVTRATTLLNGTIDGTYSLAPTSVELGGGYVFNGNGTAGDLGAVSAHGLVTLPGFVATGQASGTLTLTQTSSSASPVNNSVTLKLTGPIEPGLGAFPATLTYTITGGTGAFANASGVGSIAVTLGADMTFSMTITSYLPSLV